MQIERLETWANQDRWIFNEEGARGINLFSLAHARERIKRARAYIEANDCQEASILS